MLKNQKGFTVVELMVVVTFFAIVVGWLGGACLIAKGNYWFTEDGIARELRVYYPSVNKILTTHRNVYEFSEVFVENNDGSRSRFLLDTNVLFNYTLTPAS